MNKFRWAGSISLILLLAFCVACQKSNAVPIVTTATPTIAFSQLASFPGSVLFQTDFNPFYQTNKSQLKDEARLIDIRSVDANIIIDIRYATENNFTKRKLYPVGRCALRASIARKLSKVQQDLEKRGLGLKVYDCYRPLSVQRQMWQILPNSRYVANPTRGSRHNRGAAVDATLVNRDGDELEMPTQFDDFTVRAHRNYPRVSPQARRNRQLLKEVMKKHGFIQISSEWWHFDAVGWRKFSILDVPLELIPEPG